jgi:hypothetical protein
MHGDLYAHNILTDDAGNTLFSDFGAACFYDTTAVALERLEVSAYGYLLEDLIALCDSPKEHPVIAKLNVLRQACAVPNVLARPSFKQLMNDI